VRKMCLENRRIFRTVGKVYTVPAVLLLLAVIPAPAGAQPAPPSPPSIQDNLQSGAAAQETVKKKEKSLDELMQEARNLSGQGRHEEAALLFFRVYGDAPDGPLAPHALVAAARARAAAGDRGDAVELYQLAADRFPDTAEVIASQFQLAELFQQLERNEEAAGALERVIRRGNPQQQDSARRRLMELLIAMGRYYEAQTLAEKHLEDHPGDNHYMMTLAQAYMEAGDLDAAVDIYQKLVDTHPGNQGYEFKLFDVLKKAGRLDEKIQELEREKKKNPDDMGPVHALKRLYLWNNMSLDALVQLEIIVEHEPERLDDAVLLARHYYRNKWVKKARETLENILDRRPDFEPALRELGEIHFREGRKEEARAAWERAAKFNPGEEAAYHRLANYYLANHLYAEAAEIYEEGRKALGNPNLFARELANSYDYQMQREKALGEYIKLCVLTPADAQPLEKVYQMATHEDLEGKGPEIIKEAVEKYPGNRSLKMAYLEVLFSVGREQEAMEKAPALAEETGDVAGFFRELAGRRSRRGHHGQAAMLYEQAAGIPGANRPFCLLEAGRAWLASGDPDSARRVFLLLSDEGEGQPGADEALLRLAQIAEDRNEHGEARGYFARLVSEYPSSPWYEQALVGEARNAFLSGEFDAARKSFDALERRPGAARYYDEIIFYRAETRLLQLDLEEAEELYKKLANQYPESAMINDALERLMFLEGAADADTLDVQALITAEKKKLSGDLDAAESILRGITMAERGGFVRDKAAIELAGILMTRGQAAAAVDVLAGLFDESRNSEWRPRGGYMLAEALVETGRPEKALRRCQEVISEHPHSYWARRARALAGSLIEE